MITARDLTWQRQIASDALSSTCDIYATGTTKDIVGGASTTPTLRASAVACSVAAPSDQSGQNKEHVLEIERRGVYFTYTLTLPWDQTILPTDTVDLYGNRYEVLSAEPDEATRVVRRVLIGRRV